MKPEEAFQNIFINKNTIIGTIYDAFSLKKFMKKSIKIFASIWPILI